MKEWIYLIILSDLPFADHPTAVYAYHLEGSDHECAAAAAHSSRLSVQVFSLTLL